MLTTVSGALNRQVHPESLEVYYYSKNEDGGEQVHQVGQVLTVESLTESSDFVLSGGQEMEQGDYSSFEFGSSASVYSGWREGLPDDGLADVGGDEERNTGTKTVALLKELVEEEDNKTGDEELDDDQETDSGTNFRWITVHACHDVYNGLTDGYYHAEH